MMQISFLIIIIFIFIAALIIYILQNKLTQCKIKQNTLIDKEQQLETIFKNAQVGLMLITGDRILLKANQHLADILGYANPEEMRGFSMRKLHLDETRYIEFGEQNFQTLREGANKHIEYQLKHKNGSPIWMQLSGKALDNQIPADLTKGVLWVLNDLSKIKQNEQDLRTSQQEYKKLFENNKLIQDRLQFALEGTTDGLWDWDLQTNDMYFSPRAKAIIGYKNDEVENSMLSFESRIHPDDSEKAWQIIEQYLQNPDRHANYRNEFRLKHKDGHYIYALVRGKKTYDDYDNPLRLIGTITDMTEMVQMQEAYKHERDKNELYLDTAEVVLIALDKDARVTMLNRKGEETLGYKEEELLGRIWFDIGLLPENLAEKMQKYFTTFLSLDEPPTDEIQHPLITKSGKEIMFSWHNSFLRDSQDNVVGTLSSALDISKRIEYQNKLQHQAEHDYLTNLPNRTLFLDRLQQALHNAKRTNDKVVVLFIDLDHFKEINDSLGHSVGDELIKKVAYKLKTAIRKSDTVARFGGDEFAMIIDKIKNIDTVMQVVQHLLKSMHDPVYIQEHQIYVTLSIGIAVYPYDSKNPDELIKFSDAAMYKAKRDGRDNYQFYTKDMTKRSQERVMLETQLRQAIEKKQLKVHYQLQVDPRDKTVVGLEALVRWQHPVLGDVSPSKFIPLAEETGCIVELDNWVMEQAISECSKLKEIGLGFGVLSLNLSRFQFKNTYFLKTIHDITQAYSLNPNEIGFEITENQIMAHPKQSIAMLKELQQSGFKLSIDDFGTGHSSLANIKEFPVSTLKIDKSFIDNIPNDKGDVALTSTIIAMAHALELDVVAEGVEKQEQLDFLLSKNCHIIQGYFYHKPAPIEDIQKYLQREI